MSAPTTPEQLTIIVDQEEFLRIRGNQRELGRAGIDLAVSDLKSKMEMETFSFADLSAFAAEQGQPVQVAGKSFKRFYNGLAYLAALPSVEPSQSQKVQARREHRHYEKIKHGTSHRLGLLSSILARPDLAKDDYYARLLQEFHDNRVANLLAKPSTSA